MSAPGFLVAEYLAIVSVDVNVYINMLCAVLVILKPSQRSSNGP